MSPVILISGPPVVGTSSVARVVAESLGLAYFSPGGWAKQLIGGEESVAMQIGWGSGFLSDKSVQSRIDRKQLDVAEKGDVVIDGKLSFSVLKNHASLKVWLSGSRGVRVQRLAHRGGISILEAERLLASREEREISAWRILLGIDFWAQMKEADMIIDTDDLSFRDVAGMIVARLDLHSLGSVR